MKAEGRSPVPCTKQNQEIKVELLNSFLTILKERGENLLQIVDMCSLNYPKNHDNAQQLIRNLKVFEKKRRFLEDKIIKEHMDCRITVSNYHL